MVLDTRVFAGCVTGRREWPVLPAEGGGPVAGASVAPLRLACALSHTVLALEAVHDDAQRPSLHMVRAGFGRHGDFMGFNRAQGAVVEGAVLVSRLHLLPMEKIEAEMRYLQIAIDKTAGPGEHEAWGWLCEAVARHRARQVA